MGGGDAWAKSEQKNHKGGANVGGKVEHTRRGTKALFRTQRQIKPELKLILPMAQSKVPGGVVAVAAVLLEKKSFGVPG